MNNQEVIERLDILISLLLPKFSEDKYTIRGLGIDILRLADSEHTVDDIMRKLNKKRPIVDNTISKLRSMGLIRSVSKDGKTFYIRLI